MSTINNPATGHSKKNDEEKFWDLIQKLDDLVSKGTLRKHETNLTKEFLSTINNKRSTHLTVADHLKKLEKKSENTINALKEASLDHPIKKEDLECINAILNTTQEIHKLFDQLQDDLSPFDRRCAYKNLLNTLKVTIKVEEKVVEKKIKQSDIVNIILDLTNSKEESRNSIRSGINKILNRADNRKSYSTKETQQSEQPSLWDLMILALYFKVNNDLFTSIHTNPLSEIQKQYIESARTFFIQEWAKLLPNLDEDSSKEEAYRKKILLAELLYKEGMEDTLYNTFMARS